MNLYVNRDQPVKHIYAGSHLIWKVYKGSSKVWQLNKVNFMDWDSTVLKYEEVVSGNPATPPPDPTREGYTFAGWEGSWTDIQTDTDVTATYTPSHITEVNSVFQSNARELNTISYQNKAYGYMYWHVDHQLPVWRTSLDKVFDNESYLTQSLTGVRGTAIAGEATMQFTDGGRAGIVLSAMTPKAGNNSLYTQVRIQPYIVTNSNSNQGPGRVHQNGWYYTDREPAPTTTGQNSDWSMNITDTTWVLNYGYATYNRGQYFQVIMDIADGDGDHPPISSDIIQCTGSYSTLNGQRSGSPSNVTPITIDLSQKIVDAGLKKDARTTKITFKQGTSSTAPQWAAAVNAVCLYEDTLNG